MKSSELNLYLNFPTSFEDPARVRAQWAEMVLNLRPYSEEG